MALSFQEQLNRIVDNIFADMLHISVEYLGPASDEELSALPMGAVVHVIGEWLGSVVVHTDRNFANLIASSMFSTQTANVQKEQIDDSLREVANMIGGNVKSLSMDRSVLSQPKTLEAVGSSSGVQEGRVFCSSLYGQGDMKMVVTIYMSDVELPGLEDEEG